eukprot:m.41836 g.41836  ORF g.41836 m.41836 type:complete len:389 (+) comp33272_c0_seq1:3-1169(+)
MQVSSPMWNLFSARIFRYSSFRRYSALPSTLYKMIQARGPISVADYMRIVLTSSSSGYYMNRDVFGAKGDFTTSPEISQLFGEMLGIWCVHLWQQNDEPSEFRLVELGPGRGTLASDISHLSAQFPKFKNALKIDFVEISPKMKEMQQKLLKKSDIPFRWFESLDLVPRESSFNVFIAHEFFDALPVYQFIKTPNGFREIFVDIEPDKESALRMVKAPAPTPALQFLEGRKIPSAVEAVEICPSAALIIQEICSRLSSNSGTAVIFDYGEDRPSGLTLRGFKNHSLHDVLSEPGSADLTADVDFSYIRESVGGSAQCFGPITQADFLTKMGIGVRLEKLLQGATPDQAKDLISGHKMLVDDKKMGRRFKAMALLPQGMDCPYPFSVNE